jgi:hypothetical protein
MQEARADEPHISAQLKHFHIPSLLDSGEYTRLFTLPDPLTHRS